MREIQKIRLYKLPLKRERFLNRMARKGLELTDVSENGFRYRFRSCGSTEYRYKVLLFPEEKKQENTLIRGEVRAAGGEYIFEYGITEFIRFKKEEAEKFQKYTEDEKRKEILISLIVALASIAVLLSGGGNFHPGRLNGWTVLQMAVSAVLAVFAIRFIRDAAILLHREK